MPPIRVLVRGQVVGNARTPNRNSSPSTSPVWTDAPAITPFRMTPVPVAAHLHDALNDPRVVCVQLPIASDCIDCSLAGERGQPPNSRVLARELQLLRLRMASSTLTTSPLSPSRHSHTPSI